MHPFTKSIFRRRVARLSLLAGSALLPALALASGPAFPDRPVTVVVPMAAGGPTDIIARTVQVRMGEKLGQPVVIDNKAGAAGAIAISTVKRAPPDGYMLTVASATTHAVAVNVYEKVTYDPVKDFTPIGNMVIAPGVLVTSQKAAPGCKFDAFLANLRKAPGSMQFGSAGTGSLSHLSGVRFLQATKTDMLHVPYKGLSSAMNDMQSGQIDAAFDNVSSALPRILGGGICALAVQSEQRLAVLPNVPTYKELGYAGLNKPTWYGLVAPANTSKETIAKLNGALNAALASPDVRATFDRLGVTPAPTTPEEFAEQIQRELALWKQVTEQIKFEKIKQ